MCLHTIYHMITAQDCTHQETGAFQDGTTITLQDECTECSCSSGVMTCTYTCSKYTVLWYIRMMLSHNWSYY